MCYIVKKLTKLYFDIIYFDLLHRNKNIIAQIAEIYNI